MVVGYIVEPLPGAYPAGFDSGPAVEGGDCMFDPISNVWTTARTLLPGSMNNNWGIRTVFGNNPNSSPVEWATSAVECTPRLKDIPSMEEAAAMAVKHSESSYKVDLSEPSVQILPAPIAYLPLNRVPERAEIKGYNVYRLEPGQENAYIGSWTKLNDAAVTDLSFTDESWNTVEKKPYRFAVTTFYGNPNTWGKGVMSDPTFSDGVDKGRYATVTFNLDADKGDASGAKVILSGEGKSVMKKIPEGSSSVTFDNVHFADYRLLVLKPYYELISETISIVDNNVTGNYTLMFSPKSPVSFDATDYIDETRLTWTAPTSAIKATLGCSGSVPGYPYAFNPGTEMIVGQCSTPEQRADYSYGEFYIDGVSFYANAAITYSPLVWSENSFGSQIQEWRADYTVNEEEVGTWITVKLDEPILINPEHLYYFGYASVAPDANTCPVVIDKGPYNPYGCYFYMWDFMEAKYKWVSSSATGNIMTALEITDTPDRSSAKDEGTRFDIYRLDDADSTDESKWTKVNGSPVESTSYIDKDWKNLPDKDMRYAVKALFFDDVASDAVLSKVLHKGQVSLVNINLATDNGLVPEGAKVIFAGNDGKVIYRAEADADGKCEIPEVTKPVSYDVKVTHPGYETFELLQRIDQSKHALVFNLNETKALPGYVEAYPSDDNSKVEISWRKPGAYAPAEGWAYWDDGTPYAGYGTSVGFCAAAQLFNPEDQIEKGMSELDITKIAFFPTQSTSNPVSKDAYWIAKIWRINDDMTVVEVASQNAENVMLNKWNEVVLDNPYHLDGTETLLVGYEFYGSGNALGIDAGPVVAGKGDWANFGDGWQELVGNSGFNYNNLIHVYCDNLRRTDYERALSLSEPQSMGGKVHELSISCADRGIKAVEHKQISTYEYPVVGYRVYRLPESKSNDESTWTLLTEQPVSETYLSDVTWHNVAKGVYKWAVKAVYASGDSEPAFCQFGLDENGKVNAVTSVFDSEIKLTSIKDGHVLATVPADAKMRIDDTAGMHLLTVSLEAGTNDIDTGLASGIYLFRIECSGESRSFKLIVK